MKLINYLLIICTILVFNLGAYAQNESGLDSTGLPGDNFSLQGALEMFKKATSPEDFEKLINTENNSVNNLDLNGDGDIDYIRVIDKSDKEAHAIVLQVAVSATETQDVAVIELEKTGSSTASLQIIGDEDLYGEPVIVEPAAGAEDNSYLDQESSFVVRGGPLAPEIVIVNVFLWPSVRFIYGPVYRPWASPWRWHNYPGWWRPWRPYAWHVFQPRVYHYRKPFVIVHTKRMVSAHRIYTPIRASSVTVRTRSSVAITNYRITRTRTRVSRPVNNTVSHANTNVSRPSRSAVNHTHASRPTSRSAGVSRPAGHSRSTSSTTVRSNVRVKSHTARASRRK